MGEKYPCEGCGSPNATKTSWNEWLCNSCFYKKQDTKKRNGNGAGIG